MVYHSMAKLSLPMFLCLISAQSPTGKDSSTYWSSKLTYVSDRLVLFLTTLFDRINCIFASATPLKDYCKLFFSISNNYWKIHSFINILMQILAQFLPYTLLLENAYALTGSNLHDLMTIFVYWLYYPQLLNSIIRYLMKINDTLWMKLFHC